MRRQAFGGEAVELVLGGEPSSLAGRLKTLEEIGGMLGITRERVRQIEKQAKERLRQKARIGTLQDYLN